MVSAPACRKVVPQFESRLGTLEGSLLSNREEEKQVLRSIVRSQCGFTPACHKPHKKHAIAWSRPTNYFHFLSASFLTGQYLEAVCQILQCCRVPVSLWGIICVLTKLEGVEEELDYLVETEWTPSYSLHSLRVQERWPELHISDFQDVDITMGGLSVFTSLMTAVKARGLKVCTGRLLATVRKTEFLSFSWKNLLSYQVNGKLRK